MMMCSSSIRKLPSMGKPDRQLVYWQQLNLGGFVMPDDTTPGNYVPANTVWCLMCAMIEGHIDCGLWVLHQ